MNKELKRRRRELAGACSKRLQLNRRLRRWFRQLSKQQEEVA